LSFILVFKFKHYNMNYHFYLFFYASLSNIAKILFMKRTLKELYGVGILFFYFFKWPFTLGFPYLYFNGLNQNYILDFLWIYTIFLIFKDFYTFYKRA